MKILITSGGTTEAIDSVRGITNHSTGRLGKVIAETFLNQGHEVTLITTKQALKPESHPHLALNIISSVANLQEALEALVPQHNVLIHAMAVSDYTPVYMTDLDELKQTSDIDQLLEKSNSETKISSKSDYQVLFLKKTPKLISQVKRWNPNIKLIGFKLLVDVSKEELVSVARDSLRNNRADFILANDLSQITASHHQAWLVGYDTVQEATTKTEIAKLIYKEVIKDD
ncbi:phosphopantothenate--cysteine ligase [Streptococcus thoraltensis]|uniref:phosphopantothenate--cysteine ligase n=1 Tax=Streptococcus thoraltensis TaxID=55085 RepID=UPI0004771DCF|nr:phosphopantothenate--cysteine ligase [Streptococcus thoraltensis]MDY4761021.1 phosphopantothenate--cysteine ligase [Streptococcus thoraltensis]